MTSDESSLPCVYSTQVTFPSERFCELALKVLQTESGTEEGKATVVYTGQGNTLSVAIQAINSRTLRVKVNAFYEACYLVSSIIETFPPKA